MLKITFAHPKVHVALSGKRRTAWCQKKLKSKEAKK